MLASILTKLRDSRFDGCLNREAANEIERLQQDLANTNDALQLHQSTDDYEAGRFFASKACETKIEQLQAEKQVAIRLLKNRGDLAWGWDSMREKHCYFIGSRPAGDTLDEVLTNEAKKKKSDAN